VTDRLAVVELIGATTTKTGLTVKCAIDPPRLQKGVKVSDAQLDAVNPVVGDDGDGFHPEWNYSIRPGPKPRMLRT